MSESEAKPLHVRVAEALGCEPVRATDLEARARQEALGIWGACWCKNDGWDKGSHSAPGVPTTELARYDTDWAATGPEIERLRIWIAPNTSSTTATYWNAGHTGSNLEEDGDTALLAACKMILALKVAGKLPSRA